jgi:acyl-coenzyme A synthetase/AMP-(fatty) acid ligase
MHSHNTLYAMARSVSVPLELGPDTVVNTPMAMTHQAGFSYGLLMPLVLGGTSVWVDSDGGDGGHLLDTMERYGVTFAYLNPDGVAQLVAAQRQRRRTGLRLQSWATGSALIPPELPAEADAAPGVQLHALWGMTENGAVTVTRPGDPRDWAARSDGRPVPWMETRIVDEQGAPVAEGQAGRLEVRGANQCLGYYKAKAVYRELVDQGGWFDTGDLARGGIKIAGRVKDVINRGGVQVPAAEVENELRRHPKVADAALVGEPWPGWVSGWPRSWCRRPAARPGRAPRPPGGGRDDRRLVAGAAGGDPQEPQPQGAEARAARAPGGRLTPRWWTGAGRPLPSGRSPTSWPRWTSPWSTWPCRRCGAASTAPRWPPCRGC